MKISRMLSVGVCGLTLLLAGGSSAWAQVTWSGSDSTNWSDPLNWSTALTDSSSLNFGGTSTTSINDGSSGMTAVGTIQFLDPGFTLSTGPATIPCFAG